MGVYSDASKGQKSEMVKKLEFMTLGTFEQQFSNNGYDQLSLWPEITDGELKELGLIRGHLKKWRSFYPDPTLQKLESLYAETDQTPEEEEKDSKWKLCLVFSVGVILICFVFLYFLQITNDLQQQIDELKTKYPG
eukprot:UN04400